MDNATRLERLRLFKKVLGEIREDAPGKFNMATWAEHRNEGAPHLDGASPGCGTACCAFGYAALRTEFQDLGLTLEPFKYVPRHWTVSFEGVNGLDAGIACFGINRREAEGLFDSEAYAEYDDDGDVVGGLTPEEIRPSHVIARIDELITKYESA